MSTRSKFQGSLIATFAALTLSGPVAADEPRIAEDPNAAEGDISVPAEAAQEGKDNSSYGIEQANAAREDGRAYGDARSEAAADNADTASAASAGKSDTARSNADSVNRQ